MENIVKHLNPKIGIVFILLIILQSYLLPLISTATHGDINKYANYVYLHIIISYTIIVLSIIILENML